MACEEIIYVVEVFMYNFFLLFKYFDHLINLIFVPNSSP